MLNKDYEKVYARTFLNEVKNCVRQNKMKIEGDKEKEVDLKLEEVIKDLSFEDNGNVTKYMVKSLFSNNAEETERVFSTLVVYYAALYNDNVDLLKELLEKEFNFGHKRSSLNIGVLDKRISSKFEREDYIKLVKCQSYSFHKFYHGLSYIYRKKEDEFYIDKFSNIMKRTLLSLESEEKKTPFDVVGPCDIVKALEYFDEDAILNASTDQRKFIIDESDSYLKKMDLKDVNRVNNFLRNTNIKLALFQLIRLLPNFTDDEILKIDELFNENSRLYRDLIVKDRENNIEYFDVDRLKDILNGKDITVEEVVTKRKRFPWLRRNK